MVLPEPDIGIYWCVARNEHGTDQSEKAVLKIAMLLDDFQTRPNNTRGSLGQQAILKCSPPDGVPQPVVSWKKV